MAGIYQSGNSTTVQDASWGALPLRDGSEIPLNEWYSDDARDWHVTFLTSLSQNFGIIWGLGIGEEGEKYRIDPSLTLGFIYNEKLSDSSSLSLRFTAVLGGHLNERPCTANYGAIGGVQQVNCRFAATPLRPADTLDLLFDEAPREEVQLSVVYKYKF
ncbi:hypothetical protein [Actibacterium pelagium]|uniref:hypothetical protein n=1 Tax=Actibacterium pelagium TaxID=2029103 RepID=UPI001177A4D1|nr:hypothetical protein [Actibacterium pelagium]